MDVRGLKKAGLKATLPRMRILEILERSELKHMSAEDVYKLLFSKGEEIGLATIYRVLTQFEAAGLVTRHNFNGTNSVFELRAETHHDHMVRLDTGEVVEFYSEVIERIQDEIAEEHGFIVEDHSLVMYVRPKDSK
ncbi:MAG: ferric iron uptake transcriptional regulator [Pseudomonadota bacterium]|nr:ferric iron uptake transcriptional regulator [Pseudomonadota bacterium]